ncbi:hypothetical protein MVES_001429 [Malassezia vespertilionis]|uniref:Dynactin subunit 4 n=1 Tax=Malassezia vespertilionis TaxID=2020962 RepID=A0A2N1JCJ9_9BASI|nr:hypothetical protein MVES_001429 [Malassezia vespertilionis]
MHVKFLCPDPPRGTPLLSAEASQGQAPFYFACTACQWDSKRLGIVADKPAELHSDILAAEKPSPQQRTFDQLRVHLAPEIKKNMQWHAALTDTDARPSMPKVLADMPHLSHYVHGSRSVHNFPASTQKVPRVMEFDTPRQAARMAKRREFVAQRHAADGGPRGITDMAQRRSMPWEQPYETSLLWPQRVKLVAKHTKKCQVCAHTLIRPEQRVSSARYRTKELAMHYLPSMHVSRRNDYLLLTLVNPHKDAMQVRLASKLEIDNWHPGLAA